MTKQDAVNAYLRGDLDRRSFIRRLTAVGVSAGAAMAYAAALIPGVSANSGRTGAGYITRLQDVDSTYGTAILIADVAAALLATITTIDGINAFAEDFLDSFTADDFTAAGLDEDDREIVASMINALKQHAEALQSILDNLGLPAGTCAVEEEPRTKTDDVLEELKALANGVHKLTGIYVALAPSIENVEDRLLLAQMIAVAGRYAALLARMAGENPVPAPFEEPVVPSCE